MTAPFGVCMLNIDFYPLLGGAQMHTLRLCRYLVGQGVRVQVITRAHPGLAENEQIDGVPVYRTPLLHDSRAGASLSFSSYALRWLAAHRGEIQVVHSHEMLSPLTIGLTARRLLGMALVVNPHRGGYLGDVYKLRTRRRFSGRLRLAMARRDGDAFISVSKEISAELESVGVARQKIHFIPYALDTAVYRPLDSAGRERLRLELDLEPGIWACFAGRLVPEKGLDGLLRAWAEGLADMPKVRLLIVGDGEERPGLEALAARLGLENRVRFSGAVPESLPYLQASDLYVQPSFTEGLPIAVLEAMACGLPAVASAVGGVTDLLRDGQNGLLVTPGDLAGLGGRLRNLADDADLRARLGAQARQDVDAYCAIEQVGRAHLELYRQLAGKRLSQEGAG